ncbi:MAG: dUTP diphosphatase [Chloroflexi bacterium]|nr:dUTP diphosphatase [Chloroflexota bacterium]
MDRAGLSCHVDNRLRVRIRRLDTDLPLPEYASSGSVGFDLYCRHDMDVNPGDVALLPTGIAVATPPGYMLLVTSRSSTPRRKGLSVPHGVGVIDQDYSGDGDEILCQFYNFTDHVVQVRRGERIAQGIFVRVDRADWDEVDNLSAPTRGGFGSTGL